MIVVCLIGLVTASPLGRAAEAMQALDAIIQKQVDNSNFAGVVLVVRGEQTLLHKAYGFASVEQRVVNTTRTSFRIASLTKQFTAAAILLLLERKLLNIDDPIGKHLPDVPSAWRGVTIANLLNHTSGIFNYTDAPDYVATMGRAARPEELVERVRNKPLAFEPGSNWAYSNSNYILLGMIIEKRSGMSYAQFLRKNIFSPLQLSQTDYDESDVVIPDHARGYIKGRERDKPFATAPQIDISVAYAAGGLRSTTADLLEWQRALFGYKLLSKESIDKMIAPHKADYGFGLFIKRMEGLTVIGHSGGIPGFSALAAYVPETKLSVVLLANVETDAVSSLAGQIILSVR
jgi:CubicO group peptidase (beta-lactamase class C family)